MKSILGVVVNAILLPWLTAPGAQTQPPSTQIGAASATRAFRVRDFGASCNGESDDTAAVQSAIDAAEAAGGGVVEFPSGTCLLNSCRSSSHPWFFYNLLIKSNVTLSGTTGTLLLQGPRGRHDRVQDASEVRNTVLAFGADYTVIRFQNSLLNGGFETLRPTREGQRSISLTEHSRISKFQAGDFVAIFESTKGDVLPTEVGQIDTVNFNAGTLNLKRPLTRSFPAPVFARITALVTRNVGLRNITVQGTEPLAVTEAVGFRAENNRFLIETGVGRGNVTGLNLNTLDDFQFIGNVVEPVGTQYAKIELTQRNSRNGLFQGNSFTASTVGFGEYAAHIKLRNNQFRIHPDPSVVAGVFLGGEDIEFSHNDIHCGNITGGSGWGAALADFIGPAEYARYVGRVRIVNNSLDCRADGNACIVISAADTSVIGNTIAAEGSALGIHAESSLLQSNSIKNNTLSMGSGDGILVVIPATGGSGTVVSGNTIKGSGACGITVDAHGARSLGGATVLSNRVSGFRVSMATK